MVPSLNSGKSQSSISKNYCLSAGWKTQPINMLLKMSMTFQDCYKNFITQLCDWSNWSGTDAKLLDECDDSSSQDITLLTYAPTAYQTTKTNYWTPDPTKGAGSCWSVSSGTYQEYFVLMLL